MLLFLHVAMWCRPDAGDQSAYEDEKAFRSREITAKGRSLRVSFLITQY